MKRLGNWIDLGRVASWHLWAVASVLPCRRRKQRGRISVATGPGRGYSARPETTTTDILHEHQLRRAKGMNLFDIHADRALCPESCLVHRS
jgi:hypothetical protein